MARVSLSLLGLVLLPTTTIACECAMEVPATFCATLSPEWNPPDAVVLGVKLNEVYYGMRVKVLEVFGGDVAVGDTLTVWGDNGALCRWYVGAWSDGDTVVWGFHDIDLLGNEITAGFPPDLEQPGDHHINICGQYWLPYQDGGVDGAIAPGIDEASLAEFREIVTGCLATLGVTEGVAPEPITVRAAEGGPWIALAVPAPVDLIVTDASGRVVMQRRWNGSPVQLRSATGAYVVQVRYANEVLVCKVLVE